MLGSCLCDTFFTISGLLAFYNLHKIYVRNGNHFSLEDILKLYLRRYFRFAPMVFGALFFGIYVMPWLHGNPKDKDEDPIYYAFNEVLFEDCQNTQTLVSKFLMFSNIRPLMQSDMDNCMGWSWFYECEMQLYLFAPIFVVLYHKLGRKICYLLFSVPLGLGIWVNYSSSYKYQLTAGIFSMQTCYFMYSYYLNKPWYKVSVYMLGIISGMFFVDIREYKRSKRERTRDHEQYALVNFLHRSHTRVNGSVCKRITPPILIILAVIGLYAVTFIAFPCLVDPYLWSNNQNAWYYATTRIGFSSCIMIIFFYIVLDHNPLMIGCCTAKNNQLINAFVWPCYVIAPMVYMNMFCTVNESVYMTMINNVYLGMGSMWCTFAVAIVVMVFYLHPIESLLDLTVRKWLEVAPIKQQTKNGLSPLLSGVTGVKSNE